MASITKVTRDKSTSANSLNRMTGSAFSTSSKGINDDHRTDAEASQVASNTDPANQNQGSSVAKYEYIDSGDLLRLERLGETIIKRSCPSATWPRTKALASIWKSAQISYIGMRYA